MPWGLIILMFIAAALLVLLAGAYVAWRLMHPPRRTATSMIADSLPADPGEMGFAFEAVRFTTGCGDELEGWLVEGRDKAGPPLVILHGWGDSRYGAMGWLEPLSPLFSRILLYDHRGHGDSTQACCTWGATEVEDAAAAAQWLAEGSGRKVVIMGYSMGAVVALAAAARSADAVAGVIADSPYRRPSQVIARTLSLHGLPGRLLAPVAWTLLSCRWRQLRGVDAVELAHELKLPLLVLHGTDDRIAPAEDAQKIADTAANGRAVMFHNADHLAPAFEQTPHYVSEVQAFLATI